MLRRWTSPRFFLIPMGDRDAALALERRAQCLAGLVLDSMRGRQTYKAQVFNERGGALIRIDAWQDILGQRVRATVFAPTGTSIDAVVVSALKLTMQHGLEVLDLAALIEDPAGTTSLVYPGAALEAIYSGAGWSVPGSDPARPTHWVGKLRATSDGATPPAWAIDFPREGAEDPPAVTDGHHVGLHGAGATNLAYLATSDGQGGYQQTAHAGNFTGLARALVQAWRGAGYTADEIAAHWPAGFDTSPGAMGLVQDPDGLYWACEVGTGGLRVQRMVSGYATIPVVQWLGDASLTGDAAKLATAYVLADLIPDSTAEVLTLLSAEDIAGVYDGQGVDDPPVETVLLEDDTTGRTTSGTWSWISTGPTPASGSYAHEIANGSAASEHGYLNSPSLSVPDGLVFTTWIWIDPDYPTREIMLQIKADGSYYYPRLGEHLMNYTGTHVDMGPLPPAGEWFEWSIPVSSLWSGTKTVDWFYYSRYNGRVVFDKTSLWTQGSSYATEVSATPLMGGWTWSVTAAQAAIVTHRAVNEGTYAAAGESALSTVAITWSGGVPSATLSVGTFTRYRPARGYHALWYGAPDALQMLRYGDAMIGDVATAPIFAWYDDSGALQTYSYYPFTSGAEGVTGEEDGIQTCDGVTGILKTTGSIRKIGGGYGLSDPTPYYIGSGSITTAHGEISGTETGEPTLAYSIEDFGFLVGAFGWGSDHGGCGVGWFTILDWLNASEDADGPVVADITGPAVGTEDKLSVTNLSVKQIAVKIGGLPDVVWDCWKQTASSGTADRYVYEKGLLYGMDVYAKNTSDVTPPYTLTASFGTMLMKRNWDMFTSDFGSLPTVTHTTPTVDTNYNTVSRCVVGSSVVYNNTGSTGYSGDLEGGGQEPAQAMLFARISTQWAAIYTPYPEGNLESSNWDGTIPTNTDCAQWVGSI